MMVTYPKDTISGHFLEGERMFLTSESIEQHIQEKEEMKWEKTKNKLKKKIFNLQKSNIFLTHTNEKQEAEAETRSATESYGQTGNY